MTVDQELRELADHELDVMRGRLEEMAKEWEADVAELRKLAGTYERRTGRRSVYWDGQAGQQAAAVRQLRNVLAGRDAEDDGR